MKAYRFILALSVLAVSACSVKEINETAKTSERELTIEAYRADDDAQTKTYLKESDGSVWWVPGDAISLFYGSGSEGGSLFSSQATDTAKVTNFTGTINVITGGAEVSLEDTFFWGLYPYSESASCDGTGVTMTLPAVQTAQAGTFATGAAPSIGRSQGLHMGFYNICGGLKFSVTKAGVNKVTLKSRNGESIAGTAKVSFDSEGLPVSEILDGSDVVVLSAHAGETFEHGKFYYILMFPATMAGGFTVTLETASETATYEKTTAITAKRAIFGRIPDIDAGLTYRVKIEAVDLGLSVKWAPFNLGASAPEGYGDYFAWGETAPKEEYDFGTYSLCDESYNSLQKYNNNSDYGIVDDKTVLEPEDDAAHVNWGGSWRMPTDAEFTELIQNCTCTLTTLNGIHGIRMTSNVEGYTDKSIFLPASGSRVGTRLLMIDARGTYWSSSLYTERSYKANTFDFYSSPQPGSNPLDRYTGLPVRPVCE